MVIEVLCYLAGGALSGLLAGLLGIGGGLVVVPFLAFALPYAGFPSSIVMHVAVATSLANIVATSVVSAYSHHRRGGVRWEVVRSLFFACIVGATVGGILAGYLSSNLLSIIFGSFVFLIAYMLLKPRPAMTVERSLPQGVPLYSSVFGISAFCSLLGMGGGSLMVPFLNYYGLPMRNAVGTSSACGLLIALSGLICLMIVESHLVSPAPWMLGYLYFPAFLCMTIASIAFAPLGAKLAHTLPVPVLKKFFAGFLIIVGITMLYKSLT